MKKALFLLLALVMCLALCACGNDPVETENNGSSIETTQGATEETEASNVMGAEVLKFTLLSDKTYSVAASDKLYSYDDIILEIPAEYNGKAVTEIAEEGFSECYGLVSVSIPDSIISIYHWAFYNCTSLASISISDSTTTIGREAFYNTEFYNNSSNWEDGVLFIENWLIEVDSNAISGDYTIKTRTKHIGTDAFGECTSLTSVIIPDTVTDIGSGAFAACSNLTSVTIPNSVTKIGNWAFSGCTSLLNITIPDNVTSIGEGSFCNCQSLACVEIPNSVSSIGLYAFEECISMTEIYYHGTIQQWKAIDKKTVDSWKWDSRTGDYVIHCKDGDISK